MCFLFDFNAYVSCMCVDPVSRGTRCLMNMCNLVLKFSDGTERMPSRATFHHHFDELHGTCTRTASVILLHTGCRRRPVGRKTRVETPHRWSALSDLKTLATFCIQVSVMKRRSTSNAQTWSNIASHESESHFFLRLRFLVPPRRPRARQPTPAPCQ